MWHLLPSPAKFTVVGPEGVALKFGWKHDFSPHMIMRLTLIRAAPVSQIANEQNYRDDAIEHNSNGMIKIEPNI